MTTLSQERARQAAQALADATALSIVITILEQMHLSSDMLERAKQICEDEHSRLMQFHDSNMARASA